MTTTDAAERWMAFEQDAMECMRDAGNAWCGTGSFNQLFCFLIVPASSAARAYSFSVRRRALDENRYFCVRTEWDRCYDGKQFESIPSSGLTVKPTLKKELVKIPDEFAETISKRIADISVPLFVEHGIQIDGTHYELSHSSAKLTWKENVPDGWSQLAKIAIEFAEHMDELLATSASPAKNVDSA